MASTMVAGSILKKIQVAVDPAKVGTPIGSPFTLKDGHTIVQAATQGAAFYNPAFGTHLVSTAIQTKWQSLATQANAQGESVQDYLGSPVGEVFTLEEGGVAQYYERGMIVVRSNGHGFVVYGDIYLHYRELGDVTGFLGLPLSDVQFAANGGLGSLFDNGDIYWSAATGAHEIHGAIRGRWLEIGGAASAVGYPSSDESSIMRNGVEIGRFNSFPNGSGIYWSAGTGAFEVYGAIYALWNGTYGGPIGPLGFPLTGETSTPDAGGRFNNFQNGIIVWHGDGSYQGAYAFGDLELFIQNFESDWNTVHVEVKINSTNPSTGIDNWYPSDSSYGDNPSVQNTVWSIPLLNNATTVSVFMDALGSHQTTVLGVTVQAGADERLGRYVLQYDITNLWGLLIESPAGNPQHAVNQDADSGHHVNFNFRFKSTSIQPAIPPNASWRSEYYWPFHNFSVAELSKQQFAQTFSDVEEDPYWYSHPFDALYYDQVYKGSASSGACFGMCLEAVYALANRSLFSEPIFNNPVLQYPTPLASGGDPDPTVPADAVFTNPICIKFGYQLGASAIDFFLGKFVTGATHDPKMAFQQAHDYFNAGEHPVLCMTANSFGGGGHTILPYEFDASNWTIKVANPNAPYSRDANDSAAECVLTVDPANNTFNFNKSEYSGGDGSGGRMWAMPFSVLNSEPRTPFWEVFALLVGGTLVLLGDGGETRQVTDGLGRTFYKYTNAVEAPPGSVAMLRSIKDIETDGAKLIPNMCFVPQVSGAFAERPLAERVADFSDVAKIETLKTPPEIYYLRREPIFSAPAAAPKPPAANSPAESSAATHSAVAHFVAPVTIASPAQSPGGSGNEKPLEVLRPSFDKNDAVSTAIEDELKAGQFNWEVTSNPGGQYSWGLRSPAGAVTAIVPGSSTSDIIQIASLAQPGQAVTLTVSPGGAAKTASVTLVGTIPAGMAQARIFELTGVPMGIGAGMTVQLDNGGQELVIQNPGAAANVGLRIQSGAEVENSATRTAVAIAAGAVMKILPADWTPANIARTPVVVQHLDKVDGTVVNQSQI